MAYALILALVIAAIGVKAEDDTAASTAVTSGLWWGSTDKDNDTSIREFKIEFSDEMVEDLVYRLENRREIAPSLENTIFKYGLNSNKVPEWLNYWARNYSFSEREDYFNQFSHYKILCQGLDIHFLWFKQEACEGKTVIPLLMSHGWPGSFREFYDIIPLLIAVEEGRDFVFELVIPSLPGFGYSEAPVIQGMGAIEVGDLFVELMEKLGYSEFVYQGGDWGAIIGSIMATRHPDKLIAFHTNMATAPTVSAINLIVASSVYPAAIMDPDLVDRLYPLATNVEWYMDNFGYLHMQATKPDTLGIGLTDSPSGLLTWIFQGFAAGGNKNFTMMEDGGIGEYDLVGLLDNLMLYWSTGATGTSMRLYAETFNWRVFNLGILAESTSTPTCIMQAKNEIFYMPPAALNMKFTNIKNITVLNEGGHFLAMTYPDVMAENIFNCITTVLKNETTVDE